MVTPNKLFGYEQKSVFWGSSISKRKCPYMMYMYHRFVNMINIIPVRNYPLVKECPLISVPAPMAERSEAQSCSLADDCSSIIVS